MADILLSVGMQTGSAETSEFISKLSSIVNSINKSDSTEIKMRPVIDSAGFNELKAQLSTISSMVDQISQKKFDLTVNLDNSMEMKERLGAYQEQIREYVRNVQDAYSAIGQITKSGPTREMGTEANQYIAPALEAITQYGDALGKLETRLDKTSSMAGAERIAQDAQKMYAAIQPLIELARDKGVLSFGENDFRLPAMMSEAASSATGLGGILDSLISSIQSLSSAVTQQGSAVSAGTQEATSGLKAQSAAANEAAQAYRDLMALQRNINSTRTQIAGLDPERDAERIAVLSNQLLHLTQDYDTLYNTFSRQLSTDQLDNLARGFDNASARIEALNAKAEDSARNMAERMAESGSKALERLTAEASKLSTIPQKLAQDFQAAASAIQTLKDPLSSDDARTDAYERLQTLLTGITQQIKDKAQAEREAARAAREAAAADRERENNLKSIESLLKSVEQAQRDWSSAKHGASSEDYNRLETLRQNLENLKATIGSMPRGAAASELKQYSTEFTNISRNIAAANENVRAFGGGLTALQQRFAYMFSLVNIVMKAIQAMKQMVSTAVELDSALNQLQIVTGSTGDQMARYSETVAKMAKDTATSTKDLIDATTVYARLGYTLDESNTLAKYTAMLQGVGDIDASSAQSAITAITKAYGVGVDQIEDVMNKLVVVGNNFPISVAELAEGMNNAGSALASAGNSFEQSIALLTAANTTVQNISKSSTGLRTITARIRGTKVELDELGETIETAKYEKVIDSLTKHNVALTTANGEYRSTYEILSDIADIWGELSTMEQAAIAEQLAGNRQQNVFYSIINQFQEASNAMQAMENSANALSNSYNTYLDSIQAHINQFKAAFQALSQTVMQSDLLKGIVDFGTKILNIVNLIAKLTNSIGGLKTVLIAAVGVIATIKIDRWIGTLRQIPSILKQSSPLIATFANTFRATFDMARLDGANAFQAFFTAVRSGFTEMISLASAAQVAVAGIFALFAVASMVSSAIERARAEQKAIHDETYNTSMANAQQVEGLYDLYEAYEVAKAGLDDTAESKAAVQAAAEALAAALGIEKSAVDNLSDSYEKLTKEQLEKAAGDALVAVQAAREGITDVWKTVGQYDDARTGMVLSFTNPNDDAWKVSFGSIEERADAISRAYENALQIQRDLATKRERGGLSFQEENQYKAVTAFVNKFSDSVGKLQTATSAYDNTMSQIENITDGTVVAIHEQEKALSATERKVQTIVNAFTQDGYGGAQYKQAITNWLSGLDSEQLDKYTDAVNRGATSMKEAEQIIRNVDLVSKYNELKGDMSSDEFAETFEAIGSAAEEAGMRIDEFIMKFGDFDMDTARNIQSLTSLEDELEAATAALKAYNDAISGEHGEVASQYTKAYQKFIEDWNAGKTGTKAVQAAVELFLPDDVLRDFDYDIQEAGRYLASEFFQAIYSGEGDPGINFANYIRDHLAEFGDAVQLTDNLDGTFDFAYSSIEDLAYITGMSEEAVSALLDSLDQYGVQVMMSAQDTAELASQLGLVQGQAASTQLEIQNIANTLAASGKKSTEIRQILESLQSAGYVDLSGVQGELGTIISQAGEFYQQVEEPADLEITDNIDDVNARLDALEARTLSNKVQRITIYETTVSSYRNAHAKGTKDAPGGETLVNELGPELISENGRAYIAGGGKPTVVDLEPGAIVLDANDTKRALSGYGSNLLKGVPIRAAAFSRNTAVMMSYGGGGSSKKKYDPIYCKRCGTANPKDRVYCVACGANIRTGAVPKKPPAATIPTGSGGGSGSGSSGGGGGPGGSGSSSSKSKEETWFEKQYKEHQHLLKMEQESQDDYLKWLEDAYKKAYDEGIIDLDEYRKYQEEIFTKTRDSFKDKLGDLEFKIEMEQKGDNDPTTIINYYQQLICMVQAELDKAYADGKDDNDEYVQYLLRQQQKYYDGIKDTEEKAADEAKQQVKDLVDYRIKMLKQYLKDEIDANKKRISYLKDFYDKQKEMLQDAYDEEEYLDEQSEKRKSIADIQAELQQLEFDDSAWAQKRKQKLLEELADSEKDLAKFEKQHALEIAQDELDKAYDAQVKELEAKIEELEEKLNNPQYLYETALKDVQNNSEALYLEMIEYNNKYGTGIKEDIVDMWEEAYKSLKRYYELYGEYYKGINLVNATGYVEQPGDNSVIIPKKGYASGTSHATPGLHPIDELGEEYIFQSKDGTRYRMFSGGEKVLNAKASNFLYKFATSGGKVIPDMLNNMKKPINFTPIDKTPGIAEINMGDIIIQGSANERTVSEIRRAQRESVDRILKEFTRLNR